MNCRATQHHLPQTPDIGEHAPL